METRSDATAPVSPEGRRLPWASALLFLAVALLLVGPALLPGRVLLPLDLLADFGAWKADANEPVVVSNRLLSDSLLQFVPWDRAVTRALEQRTFPWTNPLAGEGQPLFANPQTALFSPFTWPRLLFGLRGWAITVLLKVLVAATGAWLLARELGASRFASTLAGAAYAASGFNVVWALHPPTNVSAFVPWLAAAALRCARTGSPLSVLGLVAAAALATSGGHPETLFFGVVGVAALLAGPAARTSRPLASALRVAGAALAGFLLLAPVLAPFARALPETDAWKERTSEPARGVRLSAIVAQVLPGYLGSPLGGELDLTALVPGTENFCERSGGYAGGILLLLLVLGFRGLRGGPRLAGVVAIVSLLLAWRLPVVARALRSLPLFSVALEGRLAVVFALFGSIGAAVALESVAAGPRRRLVGLATGLFGLVLLGAGLAPSLPQARAVVRSIARRGVDVLRARGRLTRPPDVYEARLDRYLSEGRSTALRRLALPGAFWCAAGIALGGLVSASRRRVLLGAAGLGELLAFGVGFLPVVHGTALPPAPPLVREILSRDPTGAWSLAATDGVLPPDLGTAYGVRDVRSYDVIERAGRADALREAGYVRSKLSFDPAGDPAQAARLARLGARWVLSRADFPGTVRVAGAPPPGVGLYEIPGAQRTPPRPNVAPEGFELGLVLTALGAAAAAALALAARRRGREARDTGA